MYNTSMNRCPDCDGIRRKMIDGLWCSWCKVLEDVFDVRRQLQNEWDRLT